MKHSRSPKVQTCPLRSGAKHRVTKGTSPLQCTPTTPSMVAKVLVAAGDLVERGQPVVVLSAMKMETTLVAPHAGRVAALNVADVIRLTWLTPHKRRAVTILFRTGPWLAWSAC